MNYFPATETPDSGRAVVRLCRDEPRARWRLRVSAVLPQRGHSVHEHAQYTPREAQLPADARAGSRARRPGQVSIAYCHFVCRSRASCKTISFYSAVRWVVFFLRIPKRLGRHNSSEENPLNASSAAYDRLTTPECTEPIL